jgi:drug/metabolite transporter (DMT)-like permease
MSPHMEARDSQGGYVFYHYTPTLAGAIVFIIIFLITTLAHVLQVARRRTWYFIPVVIGGLFETIGYVGRAISHQDKGKMAPFIMQSVLLLVAPALFAASVYMVLGRIILVLDGEDVALIRKRWLTKIFVTGDILSFFAQAGGKRTLLGRSNVISWYEEADT